jgi:hypothetical protein
MFNVHILGYVTGRKQARIPWAELCQDPPSWIEPECAPDGFQWADPSKIRIREIYRLLEHWRERQRQRLNPLIWVTSCSFFRNSSPSLDDRQNYSSDQSTDSNSSDDDSVRNTSSDPPPSSDISRSVTIQIETNPIPTSPIFSGLSPKTEVTQLLPGVNLRLLILAMNGVDLMKTCE